MKDTELIAHLQTIATQYKTVYMWGVFGAPVTENLIVQKTKQYQSWYTSSRQQLFRSMIGKNYFAFDCVNVIKAILWGWSGRADKNYGGAVYAANGVPDISADGMIDKCKDVSTNFSNIIPGEAVWLPGHIGVYIGNGKVIECTPVWANGVQITALGNVGTIAGLHSRKWAKHGKMPYVEYTTKEATKVEYGVLIFTDDDYAQAKRLIQKFNNECAIFVRIEKPDGTREAPKIVDSVKTLFVAGGSSVGHKNEIVLSGQTWFDSVIEMGKYLGAIR
jgi:hypothetical protein